MGSWRRAGESCGKMSTVVRPNYGSKGTDNITDLAELEGLLSPFQVEKLTYFFNQFFDFNMDGKIDAADFAGLNERLRKVAGWGEEGQEYINMVDNNRVFFECLLEQVLAERNKEGLEERSWDEALAPSKVVVDSVSLSSWLHMWARMCKGSAGIDDFPIWVQLIPRVIFNVICSKMRVDYHSRVFAKLLRELQAALLKLPPWQNNLWTWQVHLWVFRQQGHERAVQDCLRHVDRLQQHQESE